MDVSTALFIICLVGIVFFQVFKIPLLALYYRLSQSYFALQLRKQSKSPEGFRPSGDAKYYDELLSQHIPYYRNLKPIAKAKFLDRVNRFLYDKEFEGKEGFEVTLETQVLVSAAAVQLTFGLKNFYLSSFDTINIYPDSFYYKPSGEYHKGNTANKGFINLSWKHFMEGYAFEKDKINLGLHEMTHALEFNFLFGDRYDSLFADYYDSWKESEEEEFDKLLEDKEYFLRRYGGTNEHEFFAVAVEHFFEAPAEFLQHNSELYYRLCTLLNQDPSNIYNDYAFNKATPEATHLHRNFLNRTWHWSLSLILLGFFVGLPCVIAVCTNLLINPGKVLLIIMGSAIIGAILQFQYFRKNYWFGFQFYMVYNVVGFGILLTFIVLLGNRFIYSSSADCHFYQIHENVDYDIQKEYFNFQACRIIHPGLDQFAIEMNHHPFRNIDHFFVRQLIKTIPKDKRKIDINNCINSKIDVPHKNFIMHKTILIVKAKGMFGIEVIIRQEVIY
ncbi:zinc-dependent peptidase [Bacteroidota bacterium]